MQSGTSTKTSISDTELERLKQSLGDQIKHSLGVKMGTASGDGKHDEQARSPKKVVEDREADLDSAEKKGLCR